MLTPKLSLDFTSATLDSRIAFSRSLNTATRTNPSGFIETVNADTARFDYNSLTLACKGLLVEEQRQNIIFPSNDFANAAWTPTEASIASVENIDPEGNANSQKLIDTAVSSVHRIGITLSIVPGTNTISIYAKAAEISCFSFIRSGSSLGSARFNLATMTATNIADATNLQMIQQKNGWVRCSMTFTASATVTRTLFVQLEKPAGTGTFAGTGTDGLFLYGIQREVGAFSTSYIPTTAAAETRNADVATIASTDFSDFWQASKGGALVQATPSTVSGVRPLVQFDDNTADNIIALRGNTTNPELYVRSGGVDQAQIDAGTIAANTAYRLAGTWATDACAASVNSGAPVLDGAATIPAVTQARLGSDGTNYLNGHLQSIEYFGEPVTSANLQVLSSATGYRSMIRSLINPVL